MFDGGNNIEHELFNLKFAAKNLERQSIKCGKEEKMEYVKLKNAMLKNNLEESRTYAENSIRQRNEASNYRRMSTRVDAVHSRVQNAVSMRNITKNMKAVVKSMDSALKSMDLEKVSNIMEQFEKEFENLDVQSQSTESAIASSTTQLVPGESVTALMQQVADEAGLELTLELPKAASTSLSTSVAAKEHDELSRRLTELRE